MLPPCLAFNATCIMTIDSEVRTRPPLSLADLAYPQHGVCQPTCCYESVHVDSICRCRFGYIVAGSPTDQTAPTTNNTLPTRHPAPPNISQASCSFTIPSKPPSRCSGCGYTVRCDEGIRVGFRRWREGAFHTWGFDACANARPGGTRSGEQRLQSHDLR